MFTLPKIVPYLKAEAFFGAHRICNAVTFFKFIMNLWKILHRYCKMVSHHTTDMIYCISFVRYKKLYTDPEFESEEKPRQ